jgi:hypothetical protein
MGLDGGATRHKCIRRPGFDRTRRRRQETESRAAKEVNIATGKVQQTSDAGIDRCVPLLKHCLIGIVIRKKC